MRFAFAALLALVFPWLTAQNASGHGLGIEARLQDSTVHIQVYYDDNSPVSNGKLRLLDAANLLLLEGTTNAQGLFSFPSPPVGKYQVEVHVDDGHFAETTIAIPPPSSSDASSENAMVSDGLSRADRTGARKWVMAVFGLVVIAAGAMLLQWFSQKRNPKAPSGSPS
jgi:nickel transport protein